MRFIGFGAVALASVCIVLEELPKYGHVMVEWQLEVN